VVFARSLPGYGNLVILDHGDKVHTLSAELAEVQVREGQSVGAGQTLGSVGGQGSARGPGLYFEVRLSGRPVDPTLWLRLRAAGDAHQDRERTR
jgi:septal ring factor EnvC (AmiA/AmiB activator)